MKIPCPLVESPAALRSAKVAALNRGYAGSGTLGDCGRHERLPHEARIPIRQSAPGHRSSTNPVQAICPAVPRNYGAGHRRRMRCDSTRIQLLHPCALCRGKVGKGMKSGRKPNLYLGKPDTPERGKVFVLRVGLVTGNAF